MNTITESKNDNSHKVMYFYHMVPKGTNLKKYGITSLKWQYLHDKDAYHRNSFKYRDRIVNGWDIYPNRDKYSLSDEEILYALDKFRGEDGANYIYFFKYPPYNNLGKEMEEILKHKDIYRINIYDKDVKRLITDIDWGYYMSNTDNTPMNEEYYRSVTAQEYFKDYNETDGQLLFSHMPHIGIKFKNGNIPYKFLKYIETPDDINCSIYTSDITLESLSTPSDDHDISCMKSYISKYGKHYFCMLGYKARTPNDIDQVNIFDIPNPYSLCESVRIVDPTIIDPLDITKFGNVKLPPKFSIMSGDYMDSKLSTILYFDIFKEYNLCNQSDIIKSFKNYIDDNFLESVVNPVSELDKNIIRHFSQLCERIGGGIDDINAVKQASEIIYSEYFDDKYSSMTEEEIKEWIELRNKIAISNLTKIMCIYNTYAANFGESIDRLIHSNQDRVKELTNIMNKVLKDDRLWSYGAPNSELYSERLYPNVLNLSFNDMGKIYFSNRTAKIANRYRDNNIPLTEDEYDDRNIIKNTVFTGIAFSTRYDAIIMGHGDPNSKNGQFKTECFAINGKVFNDMNDIIDEVVNLGHKHILVSVCNTNPDSVIPIVDKYKFSDVEIVISSSLVLMEANVPYDLVLPDTEIIKEIFSGDPIFERYERPLPKKLSSLNLIKSQEIIRKQFVNLYQLYHQYFSLADECFHTYTGEYSVLSSPTLDNTTLRVDTISDIIKYLNKLYMTLYKYMTDIINTNKSWIDDISVTHGRKVALVGENICTDFEFKYKSISSALIQLYPDYKYPVEEIKRQELSDDMFGVPDERKYPLDTEKHVRSAIRLFNHVNPKYEKELADAIITKMEEYDIHDINVGENNRFKKYYEAD